MVFKNLELHNSKVIISIIVFVPHYAKSLFLRELIPRG